MNLQQYFITTYLEIYNVLITNYNNIKFKHFKITNITQTNINTCTSSSIYFNFFVLRCLIFMKSFLPFSLFSLLTNLFNVNTNKKNLLNIKMETNKVSRSLICQDDLITTINKFDQDFNELNSQYNVPNNYVMSSCTLQNKNNNQLNRMLFCYYNKNTFYKNTFRNMLLVNNISFDENNDNIEVKVFKMRPRLLTLKLSDIADKHVNDMFNLKLE